MINRYSFEAGLWLVSTVFLGWTLTKVFSWVIAPLALILGCLIGWYGVAPAIIDSRNGGR